jgi:hypothetical protein
VKQTERGDRAKEDGRHGQNGALFFLINKPYLSKSISAPFLGGSHKRDKRPGCSEQCDEAGGLVSGADTERMLSHEQSIPNTTRRNGERDMPRVVLCRRGTLTAYIPFISLFVSSCGKETWFACDSRPAE